MNEAPLVLFVSLGVIATVLLICANVVWAVLTHSLRKHGHRVTYRAHDWTRVQQIIAAASSHAEKVRYQKFLTVLHFTYALWGVMMGLFVIVAVFFYR